MTQSDGNTFSEAERAAMKQRAAEIRAEKSGGKGAAKRAREEQACIEAIDALSGTDRRIAQAVHNLVLEEAPQLDPKTWYGFPAYALNGKVVVFVQPKSKFDTRYATVGFNDVAQLDEGPMWGTSFAVIDIDKGVEDRLRRLIRKAAPFP